MVAGDTFGDYLVVRPLGRGGMGEVWLLEGRSGNLVAAKLLAATADHEARRRFLREAELALGVHHPNLVETYDVGEDPETGLCYILMEYVPGGTLANHIRKNGALPVDEAISVVEAIANVLELGRRKGIVHRDIKPANIMFDAEGTPKLADLGIARTGLDADTTTVTQTGMMIGTPAYMSPEQMLDAHHVDSRADIYSLGVVFFEMLAGRRPNQDEALVQMMARAMQGIPLPDIRTVRPEVPAPLAELIRKMVELDKDCRISTPGRVLGALAAIRSGAVAVVPADNVRTNRHPLAWSSLVVLGLLACSVMTVDRFHLADGAKERLMAFVERTRRYAPASAPAPAPAEVNPLDIVTNVAPAPPPVPFPPSQVAAPHPTSEPLPLPVAASDPTPVPMPFPTPVLPPPPAPPPDVPAPTVTVSAFVPANTYECEFVPSSKGWLGKTLYPERIDSVDVAGAKVVEVRKVKNRFGGESAVVVLGGKPRDICFLTIRAGGLNGTVSVQLNPKMPRVVGVDLKEKENP